MRRILIAALLMLAVSALLVPTAGAARAKLKREYVVAYDAGVSLRAAKAAVNRIGGKVVRTQKALRIMLVTTKNTKFVKAARKQAALSGVARNQVIGRSYSSLKRKQNRIEREGRAAGAGIGGVTVDEPTTGLEEPLFDHWQWDMRMIGATPDGSYAVQPGSKDVIVAVIDTGIDGSHPDIAPNFNRSLSRNWTTDIPLIDGKCVQDPDHSCQDPNNVDEDGHGTHVAGTIASPINGLGMAGVAPNVTLVNDRAGQDSGFFFLWETVNAIKYAGDIGADVANMSFYTDPWQFNCPMDHPALDPDTGLPSDSLAERTEQQTVLNSIDAAVGYARARGVTLIAAAGNYATDIDNPKPDVTSPDFPPGTERVRVVSDWCRDMPNEADDAATATGNDVLSVSALGPSGAKADYSNYGAGNAATGEIDVSAPGGYFRDFFGTAQHRVPENLILGPYPTAVARANKELNGAGKPMSEFVVRDCSAEKTNTQADPSPQPAPLTDCAYYQLIQGTSMASPHAVGVAALIVSEIGTTDLVHGGLTMDPNAVAARLRSTATDHACPVPATVDYTIVDRPADWTATCVGTTAYNGFYGDGIVNALAAVTAP